MIELKMDDILFRLKLYIFVWYVFSNLNVNYLDIED